MNTTNQITLKRDCEAIQIPSGEPLTLPAGAEVRITQSLGDKYTVRTEYGFLARIDAQDADALGLTPPSSTTTAEAEPKPLLARVYDQLRTCYDPEIPANIVDLGLIYDCRISDGPTGKDVEITMTLTAPGCGMGEVLVRDVREKVSHLRDIRNVEVNIVFDPPWDQTRMTEDARLALGLFE